MSQILKAQGVFCVINCLLFFLPKIYFSWNLVNDLCTLIMKAWTRNVLYMPHESFFREAGYRAIWHFYCGFFYPIFCWKIEAPHITGKVGGGRLFRVDIVFNIQDRSSTCDSYIPQSSSWGRNGLTTQLHDLHRIGVDRTLRSWEVPKFACAEWGRPE